ncbi:MAG: hypothetical protein B6I31_04970 [Desulfobacteraceae bacterium 4572_19]|nr:MAG: hypothetical protein B6I31_04970 [Desulfobacteraceae bacterium 4572_19]
MRKEIIVLILFFCFLLVSISLFSYDPSDPSINHVVNKGQVVHNLFGKVGSHIAGLCIGLFGVGAFWFPVLLLMAGIHYFMHRSAQVMFYIVIGGVLLIIATGGFTALYGDSCIIWGKKVSSGGIVGIPVKSFLLEYTNKIGSILVLILTFSIGFILVTRISILAFIARCWAYIIEFDKFLWKKIKLLWDKIKFKFKFDKNNYGKIGKLFQVTRYKIAKIFNRKKVEQLSENGMSLSDMAMSENRKLAV